MNATREKRNGRFQFPFFRRQEKWVEITGYRVGSLQLDEPIFIHADALVVGHVIAPKIQVAGLVNGSTAALETHILPGGQIWGDVYTEQLHLEPGGKLQGWTRALNSETYQQIRSAGSVPEIDASQPPDSLPSEAPEPIMPLYTTAQISALRSLQAEAASALAARAELEQSFNQRLQEVAGETAAKVAHLAERVEQLQSELQNSERAASAYQELVRAREAQLERQSNELAIARELLEERSTTLEELRLESANQAVAISELQVKKLALEERLRAAQNQIDELTQRANGLESALQTSVTHAAEQQDALVRWQELASATEKRAQALDSELKLAQVQLAENSYQIETLQAQRRRAEKAWEDALEELEQLRQHSATTTPEESENLLARLNELEAEAQRIPSLEAEIAKLQAEVQKLESAVQEQEDHLLWYKANLTSSLHDLDRLRQLNEEQAKQLTAVQTELAKAQNSLAAQQQESARWQKRAEQARALLQKRDETLARLQRKQQELEEIVRRNQTQLNGYEKELAHYLHEIQRQGQQLAEARSLLGKRDLALKQAETTITTQAETLAEFKQLAGERIKSLQVELAHTRQQLQNATAELTRTKQQLQNATAVIERHQKRNRKTE